MRKKNKRKSKGLKSIARSISDPPAKALLYGKRDRDTEHGGKKGQLTTDPREADSIVNRAWAKIYEGNVTNLKDMLGEFFSKYEAKLFKAEEFMLEDVTGDMVHETFKRLKF